MIALALACCAGAGSLLLVERRLLPSLFAPLDSDVGSPSLGPRQRAVRWLRQAGLDDVSPEEFFTALLMLFLLGTILGYSVFGTATAAVVCGIFAATFPVSGYRRHRIDRLRIARDAWPRLIDDIRLQYTVMGRSLPTSVTHAGYRSPPSLQAAFDAAHREWLLSTDFERSLDVLRARIGDPTVDLVAETLLAAHQIGGTQVNTRLAALAEDRRQDLAQRHDARSQQSGARFARVFVLIIPAGMAVVGLAIGTGRESYQTSDGQIITVAALVLMMGCWFWAGRVLRLPATERVFAT